MFNFISELEKSEILTINSIKINLPGIYQLIPNIINLLFYYSTSYGKIENPETALGSFQSFSADRYITLPYTIKTIYDQWQKGYYLECCILLRHLVEIFIQIKYFNKFPEKLLNHLIASSRKNRISFVVMFNEFDKNFYNYYYGNILSNMSHGGILSSYSRIKRSTPNDEKIIRWNEYIAPDASFVINQLLIFLYGYIQIFSIIFKNNTKDLKSSVPVLEDNIKSSLEKWWKDYKINYPKYNHWTECIDNIIINK